MSYNNHERYHFGSDILDQTSPTNISLFLVTPIADHCCHCDRNNSPFVVSGYVCQFSPEGNNPTNAYNRSNQVRNLLASETSAWLSL
ncbi:hypothetical protein PGT21_028067 [Puccinia graminis f. sp. tritici]|uniref:Uncharacterized protein n=1 Tax=Puccinia graminis f. sp. tritici TaxID=56615 RepID=A0A5B0S905_PUCGR|nr:hypothetical protein PGT21_028067 [Puccinia graminis f. sp. tritici]KAA1132984.1 hypothetical protein PGTUg99_018530 [Puccinia graminis f. sp. tritici]